MAFNFKRPGLRATVTANKAWLDFAAQATGQEIKPLSVQLPKQRAPRTTAPRTEPRERVHLHDIINLLRSHPKVAFAWRMQSGMFREGTRFIKVGVTGIPDIIGMLRNGRMYGIEVKAKGGRVTPIQQQRIDQINHDGGLAFVAYGVNDVLRAFDNLDAYGTNQR